MTGETHHVVCGEPPVDQMHLPVVATVGQQLMPPGWDIGYLAPSDPRGRLLMLPTLLGSLADDKGVLPVCAYHLDEFWGTVLEAFDAAEPAEQERFKAWAGQLPGRPKKP